MTSGQQVRLTKTIRFNQWNVFRKGIVGTVIELTAKRVAVQFPQGELLTLQGNVEVVTA